MPDAYIAVGSNIEPEKNIVHAVKMLMKKVSITGASAFYRTRPVGQTDQPDYINGMVRLYVTMDPRELKYRVLREVENALGRIRTKDRYGPRTIDLDVCLFGDRVIKEKDLVIPDPDLLKRDFLFVPALEIDRDIVVPGVNKRLVVLTGEFQNSTSLEKLNDLTNNIGEMVHGKHN
jgi:dihydroneopterin aldolase/2-amino-4-hydroxy-6-hydroxymethyldihydropteridine diphosphokinase